MSLKEFFVFKARLSNICIDASAIEIEVVGSK